MKFLQWALAIVGAVALVLVLVGLVLPSGFAVERSIVIDAPARTIYDYVVEPKQWTRWSVWTKRDPDMRITYSGPPFGIGAKWSWVSKSEGTGSMQFTKVEPDKRVEYSLFFPDFGMRRWEAFGCAKLVVTGPQLEAVAARVLARVPKNQSAAVEVRRIA